MTDKLTALIKEALQTEDSIIVPGLGSFMASGNNRVIIFNDLLKFDDGKLSGLLTNSLSLSKEDANKHIRDFVAHVSGSIDSGEVSLGKLGILIKTKDGSLDLKKGSTAMPSKVKTPSDSQTTATEAEKNPAKNNTISAEPTLGSSESIQGTEKAEKKEARGSKKSPISKSTSEKKSKTSAATALATSQISKGTKKTAETKDNKKTKTKPSTTKTVKSKEEKKTTVAKKQDNTKQEQKAAKSSTKTTKKKTVSSEKSTAIFSEEKEVAKNVIKDPLAHVAPIEEHAELPPVQNPKAETKPNKKKRKKVLVTMIIVGVAAMVTPAVIFIEDIKTELGIGHNSVQKADKQLANNNKRTDQTAEESNTKVITEEEAGSMDTETSSSEIESAELTGEESSPEGEILSEEPSELETIPVPTLTASSEASPSSGNQPYHVIIQSFGKERNADRLTAKLREDGYEAYKIPGEYFYVSIGNYGDKSSANSARKEYNSKSEGKAWVLKR